MSLKNPNLGPRIRLPIGKVEGSAAIKQLILREPKQAKVTSLSTKKYILNKLNKEISITHNQESDEMCT